METGEDGVSEDRREAPEIQRAEKLVTGHHSRHQTCHPLLVLHLHLITVDVKLAEVSTCLDGSEKLLVFVTVAEVKLLHVIMQQTLQIPPPHPSLQEDLAENIFEIRRQGGQLTEIHFSAPGLRQLLCCQGQQCGNLMLNSGHPYPHFVTSKRLAVLRLYYLGSSLHYCTTLHLGDVTAHVKIF